jgi:hypothetical protein
MIFDSTNCRSLLSKDPECRILCQEKSLSPYGKWEINSFKNDLLLNALEKFKSFEQINNESIPFLKGEHS